MRAFFGVLGVLICLFSLLFVATGIAELAGHGDGKTPPAVLVGIVVFFAAALAAGGYLAWRMLRPRGSETEITHVRLDASETETRLLAAFAKVGGRATVAEIAVQCGLTLAESDAALQRLLAQGAAEVLVATDGTLVYSVTGFLSSSAKAGATDPLAS